jgi:hypothetical protein
MQMLQVFFYGGSKLCNFEITVTAIKPSIESFELRALCFANALALLATFAAFWLPLHCCSPRYTNLTPQWGRLEGLCASWGVSGNRAIASVASIPASAKLIAPLSESLVPLAAMIGLGCVFSLAVCYGLTGLSAIRRRARG